ncbi:hypothetical protein QAD02_010134 [Eretmocerus hayati]|uniref:Uncharacterized protein n=1 Tax=Eretmocerus hayati TaxID=131215 RepID=A0ACC2NCN0_9HYME|nr:hypothetical protein QAD02_010134 [Eretmocerus hayati]
MGYGWVTGRWKGLADGQIGGWDRWIGECMGGWVGGPMGESRDGWADISVSRWIDGWSSGWGWWISKWLDDCVMDVWVGRVCCPEAGPEGDWIGCWLLAGCLGRWWVDCWMGGLVDRWVITIG